MKTDGKNLIRFETISVFQCPHCSGVLDVQAFMHTEEFKKAYKRYLYAVKVESAKNARQLRANADSNSGSSGEPTVVMEKRPSYPRGRFRRKKGETVGEFKNRMKAIRDGEV